MLLLSILAIMPLIILLLQLKFKKIKILKYIGFFFFCIFLVINSYVNYFEMGMFNQLVLNNFSNSKIVSVTLIRHTNDSNNSAITKSSNDSKIIKDLLTYLKQFKLVQYNGKFTNTNDYSYEIYLETNKKNEKIMISITNENYINVFLETTKTYHLFLFNMYDNINKDKNYKIINGKINYNFLNALLETMQS
ncbi:hypothetical protein SAMN05660242_2985 [Thermoanaerobacterium sp. RBIITD]|nr:hypothetical protein SAMN05660242_2985 [Thermoanaerobacterium sp. RBIITD]